MKRLMLGVAVLAALATVPVVADDMAMTGDPALGEKVFKKCAVCHTVGEDAKNRVGPVLNDVFGRTAGTYDDFKYSKAMQDAGANGLVWTPEVLKEYLKKPRDYVKGTKMTFAGLSKPEDEDNLIAYLLTFSPDYVPADAPAQ